MARKLSIGLGMAVAIVVALFFILGGQPEIGERGSRSASERGEVPVDLGTLPAPPPGATEETAAPAAVEPVAPVDPATPPLLRGVVLGEGSGVPGADVLLFRASRVESLIERLESEVTALAGGGVPDIPAILRLVRGELEEFRRSAVIVRTDDEGRFEVRGIEEGGYFLLTVAPRWLFRYGDVVALAAERTEEITIALERGAAIAGRVVRADGSGIEGIRVIAEFAPPSTTGIGPLVRKALRYVNGEFLKGPFEVVSGVDGAFEIASLPPGTYHVTAYDEKGLESTVPGVTTGTTGVLVLHGDPATIAGILATPQGYPLAEVPILLERVDQAVNLPIPGAADFIAMAERILGDPPREAVSAPDGAFVFRDLGAGRYRLTIETPGLNPHQQELRVEWGELRDLGEVRVDAGRSIRGVVRAENGGPIEGAAVQAMGQGGGMGMMGGGAIIRDAFSGRLRVLTRRDGSFEIFGLRAGGEYEVHATAAGYSPATQSTVTPDGPAIELTLAPGQDLAGIVVRADTGEGIAGATVRAGAARAETDGEGRFFLVGVIPSGNNAITIGTGSGLETDFEANREAEIQVRSPGFLRANEKLDLDRLPAEMRIALTETQPIEGIVRLPDGAPAPGALVRLTPEVPEEMGPFQFDTSLIFFGVEVADADGRFTMARYFADPQGELQLIADLPGHTRGKSATFQVADVARLSPFDISLRAASTIRGVVTDGTDPIPGAAVRLSKPAGDDDVQARMMMQMLGLPKGGEVVHTDGEGRFRFESHEPGEFEIAAEMVGFSDSPAERFTLLEGATVEFRLALDPGSSLSGAVTDDYGAPVEGAVVRILQEAGGDPEVFQAQLYLGGAFRSARTGADGRYELIGLPAGGYTVIAEKRGFARTTEDAVYVSGAAVQDLSLVPSASLRGQVIDNATGRPIPDFALSVAPREREVDWGRMVETVSDPDGIFTREDLAPGAYDIEVRAAGFGSTELELLLRPGGHAEPVIALERAGRLRGVVRDAATNEPVAGATVAIAKPREKSAATDEEAMREFIREAMLGDSVRTNEAGEFLLDTVPPGEPLLVVNHDDYVQLRYPAPPVRRGEEGSVTLALSTGRKVAGVVRTSSGEPPGVRYLIVRGDDDTVRPVRKGFVCMPGGEFTVSGLEPGLYRIFVAGPRTDEEGVSVEVGAADVAGVEVLVREE